MKIIRLSIDNIGGVEAVELTPDGDHVIIGGKNAAGKSSILHAIAGALGGRRERGEMPLREGAEDGRVVIDLGDLIVRWRTTSGGRDTLTVESADGARFRSPQAKLAELFGNRTFDPLAFFAAPPSEQTRILADLVGVDLDEIDRRRRAIYDERRTINRDGKRVMARAEGIVVPDDIPDEPVDVAALATQIRDVERATGEARRLADAVVSARRAVEAAERAATAAVADDEDEIAELERQIAELERRLDDARQYRRAKAAGQVLDDARRGLGEAKRASEASPSPDPDVIAEIERQMADAERINDGSAARHERERLLAEAERLRDDSRALTRQIEEIDAEARDAIAAADLPLDGLGVADGVVTYQGRPLSVLSSSEQLRVSVALGIATHPEIGVMLIDRWQDLDDESRAIVTEMADAAGVQIWTTVVGEHDPDITVVIRDGRVAEGAQHVE